MRLEGRLRDVPVFSFHLATTTLTSAASALFRPPDASSVPGLRHAECMTVMALGSPILSPARMQVRQLACFASWADERRLDAFLTDAPLGRTLASGWHVRLEFLRRWGRISEFDDLPESVGDVDPAEPVVAVTLARLRLSQLPRFIRWGKPVEELVRDHPGTTLALAATRPPRTVSTFSVWQTQREMTDMVHGRGLLPNARRHATAMVERERRDFHHEFTTLRFRALTESGSWQGRTNIVPSL